MRMSNNVGVALGPAIGGMIAVASYQLAFYCAAAGLGLYGVLIMLFAAETLPGRVQGAGGAAKADLGPSGSRKAERFGGYDQIFRDRPYIRFIAVFTLVQLCAALIWVLMGVYAKHNYGVPENQYGLIPMTNALMVVFFQIAITRVAKRYAPLRVLALGSLFYAIATGMVALATGFWGFWLVIVVMTVGELILVPTSSTYAANMAPADKRGRYMSLYGLTWGVASGIGPVMGGALNDTLGPRSPWIVGCLVGLSSTFAFLALATRARAPAPEPVAEASLETAS
jgi:MFS family permease